MSREVEPTEVVRRVAGAFRAPEFDADRADRVLAGARAFDVAVERPRVRHRGLRHAAALAACAAVLLTLAVLPSVRSADSPAGTEAFRAPRGPVTRGSATTQSPAWSSAGSTYGHGAYSGVTEPPDAERLLTGHGLRFSTVVDSTSLATGKPLVVRLTLTNVSAGTMRWATFGFTLSVTTTFQADPRSPDGVFMGGVPQGVTARRTGPALTLRPGESTTTVLSTPLTAATWQVVGGYQGEQREPSAQTPPIAVIVRPRAGGSSRGRTP